MAKGKNKNKALWVVLAIIIIGIVVSIYLSLTPLGKSGWPIQPTPIPPGGNQSNQTNCTDSDGGINIWVKGTATYVNLHKTDYCFNITQNNTNFTLLKEYYCITGNGIGNYDMRCPNATCYDGRCPR